MSARESSKNPKNPFFTTGCFVHNKANGIDLDEHQGVAVDAGDAGDAGDAVDGDGGDGSGDGGGDDMDAAEEEVVDAAATSSAAQWIRTPEWRWSEYSGI